MSKTYGTGSSPDGWIIGGIVIILALAIFFIYASSSPSKISQETNRELALGCTTDMATQFHIHPHLEIDINGKSEEIPANIGIVDTCMHPLHTHDNTGTLHVESPEKRDFTLGDFFAVWNKPFNKNQILASTVDAHHVIRETVNGVAVQDYENTILKDSDKIVISYEAAAAPSVKAKK